jgi:hypothetical protein
MFAYCSGFSFFPSIIILSIFFISLKINDWFLIITFRLRFMISIRSEILISPPPFSFRSECRESRRFSGQAERWGGAPSDREGFRAVHRYMAVRLAAHRKQTFGRRLIPVDKIRSGGKKDDFISLQFYSKLVLPPNLH